MLNVKLFFLREFTAVMVCNAKNQKCMFKACSLCDNNFQGKIEQKVTDDATKTKFHRWISENSRAAKKEFGGQALGTVQLLKLKLDRFLFHVYVKREQSSYFEKMKSELTDEKILTQIKSNLPNLSLVKYVKGKVCSYSDEFTAVMVCNDRNQKCMFKACSLCDNNFQATNLSNLSNGQNVVIDYVPHVPPSADDEYPSPDLSLGKTLRIYINFSIT
ncbi:unnamed protein product [Didymodactylos carnosus]|uniref:Uncharacterized protein n=1 Tax=Didymodactylos carnosus TaxID=1234261 RepID=A0A8S2I295_9BILA|nr:unnamed protein product [Didymodactylos carnosus]CAF3707519.1 unnamed protein product [Didymodactylos carnosus]